jgi:hypothetical protein
MRKIQKVLATGKTHTTASNADILEGRHDGKLNIHLSAPRRHRWRTCVF